LRYYLYDIPKERFTSSQAATAVNPNKKNFRSSVFLWSTAAFRVLRGGSMSIPATVPAHPPSFALDVMIFEVKYE
jgi:hypothetical protein